MYTISIKRSVAALAITAGLLTATAPAGHASVRDISNPRATGMLVYDLETVMISGVHSGTTLPDSSAKVSTQDGHASKKAKRGKGKRGKGKPKHTYDIQSSNPA